MKSRRNFLKTTLLFAPVVAYPKFIFGSTNKDLPKVLIIGDSISGGYLPFVMNKLQGIAEVQTPQEPGDGGGTTNGVLYVDKWIEEAKWAVIHFNFGLHDIKHIHPETGKNSKNPKDPHQADLKQYEKNLNEIVGKLKTTDAKLIFATTTPYPDTATKPMRLPGMPAKYNEVAIKIMKENGVVIDDLYALVLPRMAELQIPDNVHFTEAGYKVLGKQVADKILEFI